jgi:PTS system nitrogen regulatory IIA component
MKLSEIISRDSIVPDLKARDKAGVLRELAKAICKVEASLKEDSLVKLLEERERLGSTGIGEGVAIPHGKINGIDRPLMCFGRSKQGVDFDSMDAKPVYLFFLLVAPENSAGAHLKVLAKIAKMLKNSGLRKRLLEARDTDEIYSIITQSDEDL